MNTSDEPQTTDDEETVTPPAEKPDNDAADLTDGEKPDLVDAEPKLGRWERLKAWLGTTKGKIVAAGIGVALVVIGVVAATDLKYAVVGLVVKNSADVAVVDSVTHQPLPNATVSMAGQSTTTDNHGVAHLAGLALGRTTMTVIKKAYKPASQAVLVPIGRPKFASVNLVSAGINISFTVMDKINGKVLDDVTVAVDDNQAVSKDGKARLVLLPNVAVKGTAKLTKDGYLDATVEIKPSTRSYAVTLVPSGSVYFLSNRSGRLDLYSSNLDGSNMQIALTGTGKEDEQTGVLPNIEHPNLVALVSGRDGRRDSFGTLIHDLFIFDGDTKKLTKVDESVGFTNYRAWVNNYLVYQKADAQGCNSIKAYYVTAGKGSTVAGGSGNNCPTINAVYDDTVLYSVSGADSTSNGFYAIKADGGSKRQLSATPVTQISRKVKETIQLVYYNYGLSKPEVWQSLDLGNLAVTKLDSGPSTTLNRAFNESADTKSAVFVDERDGRSELYMTDDAGNNERKLTNLGSVNQFVQWFSNEYVVFSSTKSDENALYIVAIDGGQPQKITDFYRGNAKTYGGGYNPNY